MLFAAEALKPEPVIVTVAPTAALVGEIEVIWTCPKTELAKNKKPKNKDNPIKEFLFSPIRERDCTFIVVNDLLIQQHELAS